MKNINKNLILSSSTIEGTKVNTLQDEHIGDIKDIMLDTESGEVVYVVLSINSGFLNMGSKYFAIPWKAFSFNTDLEEVFVLDIDKERLENSPGFDKDNWPSGPQTEFIQEVNAYYGIESSHRSKADYRSGKADADLDSQSGLGTKDPTIRSRDTDAGTRASGLGSSSSRIDSGDSSFAERSKRDATDKHNLL